MNLNLKQRFVVAVDSKRISETDTHIFCYNVSNKPKPKKQKEIKNIYKNKKKRK